MTSEKTIVGVENRTDVVKDRRCNAVLSADINAFQRHMENRKKQQGLEKKVSTLEERLAALERMLNIQNPNTH